LKFCQPAGHMEHEAGDVGPRDGPAVPDVLPVGRAAGAGEGIVRELWWQDDGPIQALPVIAPPAAVRRTGAPAMARHSCPAAMD